MGTPIEDGQVQGNEPTGEETPGPNPAWNDVLSVLPEQFHPVVTPHFQKWDQSAQSRIEQANNSLKEFEGYKPFVEHGINAQEIEQGLRLMYEINNNPENVYNALANAYKFGGTPPVAENESGEEEESELGIDPEIAEKLSNHEGMLNAVAQIVLNEQQTKQAQAADDELDQELNALKEKIGDYDERYVLAMMQSGMSAEEAGEAFTSLKTSFNQSKSFAPNVLGSSSGGNGIPSNAIDPTKLSGSETRNLVAQMLEQAARQK